MIELEQITTKEAVETAEGNEELFKEMCDKLRLWLQHQAHLPQGLHLKIQTSHIN